MLQFSGIFSLQSLTPNHLHMYLFLITDEHTPLLSPVPHTSHLVFASFKV